MSSNRNISSITAVDFSKANSRKFLSHNIFRPLNSSVIIDVAVEKNGKLLSSFPARFTNGDITNAHLKNNPPYSNSTLKTGGNALAVFYQTGKLY